MTFKIAKTFIMLSVMALHPIRFAHASGEKGNGGGAIICKGKTPQAYDLYESERYHVNVLPWDGISTKEQILDKALKKIAQKYPGMSDLIKKTLPLMSKVTVDKEGIQLKKINDVDFWFIEKDCYYSQIANWVESPHAPDVIIRDITTYRQMDPLSQAANDLHEVIAKLRRYQHDRNGRSPEKNTIATRRMVAELLSENELSSPALNTVSSELDPYGTEFSLFSFYGGNGWYHARIAKPSFCTENPKFMIKVHPSNKKDSISFHVQSGDQKTKKVTISKKKSYSNVLKDNSYKLTFPEPSFFSFSSGYARYSLLIEVSLCGEKQIMSETVTSGADSGILYIDDHNVTPPEFIPFRF